MLAMLAAPFSLWWATSRPSPRLHPIVPGESLKSVDWAATAHRRRFLLEDAALGVQDGEGIGAVVVCLFLSCSCLAMAVGFLVLTGDVRDVWVHVRGEVVRVRPLPGNLLASPSVLRGELFCLLTGRRPSIQEERAGVPSSEAAAEGRTTGLALGVDGAWPPSGGELLPCHGCVDGMIGGRCLLFRSVCILVDFVFSSFRSLLW